MHLFITWVLLAGVGNGDHATDLHKLEEWIELERGFAPEMRAEAHATVAGYLADRKELSAAEFYLEVSRIVAMADNGHSNADTSPIFEDFGLVPLRVHWFSDGLYVVRARSAQRALLGARIESIEGRTIDELAKRLKVYCGGTQEYFRRYSAPLLLLSPPLLHAAGLAERPDRLRLGLAGNESFEVLLDVDAESMTMWARPWRYLCPVPIEGGEDWHAVLPAATDVPLWLQEEAETFRYVRLAEGRVVYLQLRGNRDAGSKRIRAFTARARQGLLEDQPRSIVFDNRANGGGDLTTTAEFALELPSFVQPGGRVYVLTDNATFSAGIYSSYFPKASDPENTVVVGELVGDRPEFWAEAGSPFLLPESGIGLGYALQRHDLLRGCTEAPECHMAQHPEHWNLVVDTLAPDWPVPMTFADFAAGRDPLLERVLREEGAPR